MTPTATPTPTATATPVSPTTSTDTTTATGDKTVAAALKARRWCVTIPDDAKAGAARLRLTLTDAAGNMKAYGRTVHIRM